MRRLVAVRAASAVTVAASLAVSVAVSVVISLVSVAPAGAAGAGGIEITPLTDGRPTSSFHVRAGRTRPAHITFDVRNVSSEPAEARLYAASVSRTGTAYAVAGAGSAPWIHLATATIRLEPGQARRIQADVSVPKGAKPGTEALGAVVEEPAGDAKIVRRVATLVHLDPADGPAVPRPAVLLLVATAMLGAAAVLVTRQVRARS